MSAISRAVYTLNYSEFYITNVCNLNCTNCNRFNNYAFSGHYHWADYADQYQQWAKLINIKHIGILGGEPFLNPEIFEWVDGIADLWPNSKLRIITNGTQLQRYPDLYDRLLKHRGRVIIELNNHDCDSQTKVFEEIENILQKPVEIKRINNSPESWSTTYQNIRDISWPDCDSIEQFDQLPLKIQHELREMHGIDPVKWIAENYDTVFVDSNGITIHHRPAWSFNECTVRYDPKNNGLSLHDSDPDKAMSVCYFKTCHHFIKGRLYKCGPVGILPEFIQQFPVQVTAKQQALIDSYEPADVTWTSDQLDKFIDNLVQAKSIDQCALCPETFTPQQFSAGTKKIKIVKL